jgi:hypothetical protein
VLDSLMPGKPVCLIVPQGNTNPLLAAGPCSGRAPLPRIGFEGTTKASWVLEPQTEVNWPTSPVAVAIPAGAARVTIGRLDNGSAPVTAD